MRQARGHDGPPQHHVCVSLTVTVPRPRILPPTCVGELGRVGQDGRQGALSQLAVTQLAPAWGGGVGRGWWGVVVVTGEGGALGGGERWWWVVGAAGGWGTACNSGQDPRAAPITRHWHTPPDPVPFCPLLDPPAAVPHPPGAPVRPVSPTLEGGKWYCR